MDKAEVIIAKFICRIECELDGLVSDMREFGMTAFVQGEGYGYITCLEILQSLMPKPNTLLNYDIEAKYRDIL